MTEKEKAQLDECDRLIEKYKKQGSVAGVSSMVDQKFALLESINLRRARRKVELGRLRSLSLAAKEALEDE